MFLTTEIVPEWRFGLFAFSASFYLKSEFNEESSSVKLLPSFRADFKPSEYNIFEGRKWIHYAYVLAL